MATNITKEDFAKKVYDIKNVKSADDLKLIGDNPVVIDFYAPWCGPCKMLEPIFEEVSEEYKSKVDFLLEPKLLAPQIITNPPFSLGLEFAEKAFELGVEKLALLVRLQFLEGVKRGDFFRKCPPKKVYVFSKRLSFNVSGEFQSGGVMAFAWFVFGDNIKGSTTVSWI